MMVPLIVQIVPEHLHDMTISYFIGKLAIIIKVCRMNLPTLGKGHAAAAVEVKAVQNENLYRMNLPTLGKGHAAAAVVEAKLQNENLYRTIQP